MPSGDQNKIGLSCRPADSAAPPRRLPAPSVELVEEARDRFADLFGLDQERVVAVR
jgi:hypothetical protein